MSVAIKDSVERGVASLPPFAAPPEGPCDGAVTDPNFERIDAHEGPASVVRYVGEVFMGDERTTRELTEVIAAYFAGERAADPLPVFGATPEAPTRLDDAVPDFDQIYLHEGSVWVVRFVREAFKGAEAIAQGLTEVIAAYFGGRIAESRAA